MLRAAWLHAQRLMRPDNVEVLQEWMQLVRRDAKPLAAQPIPVSGRCDRMTLARKRERRTATCS